MLKKVVVGKGVSGPQSGRLFLAMFALGTSWLLACGSQAQSTTGTDGSLAAGGIGGSLNAGGSSDASSPAAELCPIVPGAADVEVAAVGCGGDSCFGCAYPVAAMPFIQGTFAVTDSAGPTKARIRTEAGKVCMSGTSKMWSVLVLQLGKFVGEPGPPFGQDIPFNAAALNIAQVEFTLDTPPPGGIVPGVSGPVTKASCNCSTVVGYDLASGAVVANSGVSTTARASLTDFKNAEYVFSASFWLGLQFAIGPVEKYDFCVRELKFLDAAGALVSPA